MLSDISNDRIELIFCLCTQLYSHSDQSQFEDKILYTPGARRSCTDTETTKISDLHSYYNFISKNLCGISIKQQQQQQQLPILIQWLIFI